MRVEHAMTRDVCTIQPTASVSQAAYMMDERQIGVIPVVDSEKLVGIITDRDIALSVFVDGMHPGTPVFRLMREQVHICSDAEEIDVILDRMAAHRVRRMPVCDADGRVVGIVSLGDIAQCAPETEAVARTLAEITRRITYA